MNIIKTALPGVLILEPRVFTDDRGFFQETYRSDVYREIGIPPLLQDNHSRSSYGVLRGLHSQKLRPQGKLVRVARGKVYDVAVDVNPSSSTFGQYVGVILDDQDLRQFYIPPGYLHGFCVLSETADFIYKCTDYYQPNDEIGVIWNDADINIDWPLNAPVLSSKDLALPTLKELAQQLKS